MQPAEAAVPSVDGAFVPWMANWSPPDHPAGRFGWWPERPNAYQPNGPPGSPVAIGSVTLKRPTGVGEPAAPTAATNECSVRSPRIRLTRRRETSALIQNGLDTVRRPRSESQPVRPLGRHGRITRAQRPSAVVLTAQSQVA